MRENVLNLTAVLADGTIVKTGSRARKVSSCYYSNFKALPLLSVVIRVLYAMT